MENRAFQTFSGDLSFFEMELKVWKQGLPESTPSKLRAEHPMFRYSVPAVEPLIRDKIAQAKNIIVIGIGGSSIPLEVFLDACDLRQSIHIADTVDARRWEKLKTLENPLFFAVSKSGETLEIKALISEVLASGLKDKLIAVTDPSKGTLRDWVKRENILSLEIPSDIGGRFTHFTPFHRALLESKGINFDSLLTLARQKIESLQKNPEILETLFQMLFGTKKDNLILWSYGDRFLGLARWIQQAIAESLGKLTKAGVRLGMMPIVLQGPQDQHSVLQLLMEGPQRNAFWFFTPSERPTSFTRTLEAPFDSLSRIGLPDVQRILFDSTIKSFEERLNLPETYQPMAQWQLSPQLEDIVTTLVTVQALIEYAGDRLTINPFDQPGVERGKQIARELLSRMN